MAGFTGLVTAFAALPAQDPAQRRAEIAAAVSELVGAPALAGGRVGVEVRDLDDGALLAAHDADKGFLPASNMKLISAAVGLKTLGADFRWATRVDGPPPREDLVDADLWLVGSGDPSLGGRPGLDAMAPMRELADQLFRQGIRRVRGVVRGDGSVHAMGRYGTGWQWDYLADDYAAPCGGLNWAENVVTIVVDPGKALGDPARVHCEPERAAAYVQAAVRTSAAGAQTELAVTRDEARPDRLLVRGTVAGDAPPQRLVAPVFDPAAFAASALAAALVARGIALGEDPLGGDAPSAALPLRAEVRSPPLAVLLVPLLKHSINLYAEQLWRTAAQRATAARTAADCERHAKAMLQRLGVDPVGMVLADGSGLSRRNLVQPRQLVALLAVVHRDASLRPIEEGLPVAGRDGTLAGRLGGRTTSGHVRAKTGFVSFVACLSGYLDRPGGAAPLAFSVMVNNFTCEPDAAKAAIDAFVVAIAHAVGWSDG